MELPEGFTFSQTSLQDYVDCPRLFQLRHVRRVLWPAPQTRDLHRLEVELFLGRAFHRLMAQLYSGVPLTALRRSAATQPRLASWLAAFERHPPQPLPDELVAPEQALQASVGHFRLEARFDLLAGRRGSQWVIVEWKTGHRRPSEAWLRDRLQTRVYPSILVICGPQLNAGQAVMPEAVGLLYWFAEYPRQPQRLSYSVEQHLQDLQYLNGLMSEISERPDSAFEKTDNPRRCEACAYRALCWDAVEAAALADLEDLDGEALAELSLDDVEPVAF